MQASEILAAVITAVFKIFIIQPAESRASAPIMGLPNILFKLRIYKNLYVFSSIACLFHNSPALLHLMPNRF